MTVPPDANAGRLPAAVAPRVYRLLLVPDLDAGTFHGELTIEYEVLAETSSIVLNAADLTVTSASIEGPSGAQTAAIDFAAQTQFLRLKVERPLVRGEGRLRLQYDAPFNGKLRGLYRSTFKDENGAEHALLSTQMEPTDARRMLPCFDEPAFKAKFQISVVIDEGLTAVSNAPETARTALAGGKVRVDFAETPVMSTYLLALAVGPLMGTEPAEIDGVKVRVFATPRKQHLTAYAERVALAMLKYYRAYYGIPYPGEKMDLLAIPDFEAGAMENLGAITFRETALLVDEKLGTANSLQYVASVISHEIAHMWFGDLVTMSWWDDLWLNEAFATWMETKSIADWRPEWEHWNAFALDRQSAMATDGLVSTRAIYAQVKNPAQANEMFDVITYQKGAAILRMLEQFVGEETMREGVGRYLRRHAFGNASTADLWAAIGEASTRPVNAIMDTWVHQPGYPLLTVALDANGGEATLSVRQERFLYDPPPDEAPPPAQTWQVPVLYREGRGATSTLLLDSEQAQIPLDGAQPDYVYVNSGGHGFYRVRYAPELLRRLTARLSTDFEPVERFTIVNDAWALVRAGKLTVNEYLDLTAGYREDADRTVWGILLASFGFLRGILPNEQFPAFARLIRDRLGPSAQRLGWEPASRESDLTRQFRADVIATLGTVGEDAAVQTRARALYQNYLQDEASVDPNLVGPLVGILAYTGDEARYDEFRAAWKSAVTPEIERRYLMSLAAFREPALLTRTLADTLNGEIRTQDAGMVIAAVQGNPEGRALAWQFTKEHWDTLKERLPVQVLVGVTRGVANLLSEDLAEDARRFYAEHPVEEGRRALVQSFERLDSTLRFRRRELDGLIQYLG